MAAIKKIQLPNGNEYDIIDSRIGSTAVGNTSTPVYWDGEKFAATTSISMDDKADLVDGKVPASQLPSYVDDVIEGASLSALPATGESGKIYVTLDTNKTYRWSGSTYVEISESLAIGTTATTAAAGNHTHSEYVPTTRTINDKPLDADVTLDASDVGAISMPTEGTAGQVLTTDGEGNYSWANVKSTCNFITVTDSTEDLQIGATAKSARTLYGDNYAPYAPDGTFINYTIMKGTEWVENAVYCFILPADFNTQSENTKPTSTRINGRVRVGTKSTGGTDYCPIMKDKTTALNMNSEYAPDRDKFFIFKKTLVTPDGALYLLPDFIGGGNFELPENGNEGQVLTINADGSYEWRDVNDTKVTQTLATIDNAYPALIAKSDESSTDTTYFSENVTINPAYGEMNATQFALNGRQIIVTETATGGWLWS